MNKEWVKMKNDPNPKIRFNLVKTLDDILSCSVPEIKISEDKKQVYVVDSPERNMLRELKNDICNYVSASATQAFKKQCSREITEAINLLSTEYGMSNIPYFIGDDIGFVINQGVMSDKLTELPTEKDLDLIPDKPLRVVTMDR